MIKNYGFIKVGAATPKLDVANVDYNVEEIKKIIRDAEDKGVSVLVFPELCITSYSCGDLFGQEILLKRAEEGIDDLRKFSEGRDILFFVGAPIRAGHYLFNCGVGIQKGRILGIIPKTYIPNYNEFYEKRWFSSSSSSDTDEILFCGQKVPFGTDLLFQDEDMAEFCIGVEICEDLWAPIPPSSYSALGGATVILNLSASDEMVNKSEYRVDLVKQQSARLIAAYVYSSSGVYESTTDLVFSGHSLIAENGSLRIETERFKRESSIIVSDIDLQRLLAQRQKNLTFKDILNKTAVHFRRIFFAQPGISPANLTTKIDPYPFVPSNPSTKDERCREIFNIQVAGLAKRIEHIGCKKAVIGISGGLDSTLALLVTLKTFDILGFPREGILTITMPGFGTTGRTYNNAINLCKVLKTSLREINIVEASKIHFRDIGHDPEVLDTTYENVQARERTQILMDIANKEGGIVVGTGDLSELALGFATYNGDHMSMYGVNSGVPKTLIRSMVRWIMENEVGKDAAAILEDILNTPVSPELLPANKSGEIVQKTEDIIGPYELHDFFLYHRMRYGAPPKKVAYLAEAAFKGMYDREEILKWLKVFYRRFFIHQFKRSCLPDGPKVGSVSLSPRGDFRMPSDASASIWMKDIENI